MEHATQEVCRKIARVLPVTIVLLLLASGCATYQQQNKVIGYYRQGNLPAAVQAAQMLADKNAGDKDAIIWRLEEGAVLRANGQYDDSNKAFDMAQERIDQYEEEARVKVGHEAGALLSNQAELPYVGRAYDGIMLNTYEALNYLALGQPDKARPELIKAYERQQDAVEDNKKRIQKAKDDIDSQDAQDRRVVEDAQNNPDIGNKVNAGLSDLKPYADYVNPFTVYLDGLYFMVNAADSSDLERARKSFERVQGFLDDDNYIKQDLATVDDLINAKPMSPTTYVIFETGCAPVREQIRIDIATAWTEMPYLGAAFPTLKFEDGFAPALNVSAGGTTLTTTLLSSIDSVIGQDFKNELPAVMAKTLVSTAIKAAATRVAWQATRQRQPDGTLDNGGIAGLFVITGAVAWQAANNIADERTWTTLPKEFQYCRLATPTDRKINLSTANGGQKQTVTVGDGLVNLIYVKSITATSPLLVSQIKLK